MGNPQRQQRRSGCLTYILITLAVALFFSFRDAKPTTEPVASSSQSTSSQSTGDPSGTGSTLEETYGWGHFSELGSAYSLNGTNLIVSIFVSDPDFSWQWDVNDYQDNALAYDSLNSLSIACSWLTREANEYGASPLFYYDWSVNSDLYYETYLPVSMTSQDSRSIYYAVTDYIHTAINSDALMRKYGAGNIVYLLFVNTPPGYEINSGSYNLNEGPAQYPYEFCTMFIHERDYELWPAALAHEILHCYGARDLYMVTSSAITQQYVDYQESNKTNDIMRITFDPVTGEVYYDQIVNELSELDAYYVGLTDSSSDVIAWSLGKSGFDQGFSSAA